MSKVHLYDLNADMQVPNSNIAKHEGFKVATCGYQRKVTTENEKEVTCKICLKELKKKINN